MLTGARLRQKLSKTSSFFTALSHPSRVAIVYLLMSDPMRVRDIVDQLKLSPTVVAHHLHVLYSFGWITKMKVGKMTTYSLESEAVKHIKAFFT